MSLHTRLSSPAHALFFPDAHFRERSPTLDSANRIVVAVAGIHLVGYYLLLLAGAVVVSLQQDTFGLSELLADLGVWAYAQGPLVALLVLLDWLVVSAILHVAVKLRHGGGTYGDTLSVVGWSSPATLLVLLVGGVGLLLALAGNRMTMSFDAKLAAVAPAVALASTAGGLLALLWQGYVWPAALERAHDVERSAAAEATAATVVVSAVAVLFVL